MGGLGLRSVVRGRRARTTVPASTGWRAHTTMRTDLVLDALEQAPPD